MAAGEAVEVAGLWNGARFLSECVYSLAFERIWKGMRAGALARALLTARFAVDEEVLLTLQRHGFSEQDGRR